MKTYKEPSIFQFATKELSQDAFFSWLFSWAEDKYKQTKLHKIATNFIFEIIGSKISINNIVIKQQYKKIDILLRINNCITIALEDKVNSKIHNDQLKRYNKYIAKDFPNDKLFFVYLKTDLVSNSEKLEVEKYGYKIFDLLKLKDILYKKMNNDIYNDFLFFLDIKIKSYLKFDSIRFSKWTQEEWKGFFYKICNDYDDVEMEIWQGREIYTILYESEYLYGKKIYTSLEMKYSLGNNYGRLSILLHFGSYRENKNKIRDKILEVFNKYFKTKDMQINYRIGNRINLITFNEFPFKNTGFVDYHKSKMFVDEIYNVFVKIKY